MAYNTTYTYNVDLKIAELIFYEDAAEMCKYEYDDGTMTISARDEVVVVNPTWGTNKDIKEWCNLLNSMSGRLELDAGSIRVGYRDRIRRLASGVDGEFKAYGLKFLGDWLWNAATDTLTIAARDEHDINFAEFRYYVQWMLHFQNVVQNYG